MTTSALLVAPCALSVFLVCLSLVLHPDYEDGLIGRIALAAMAVAGITRFMDIVAAGAATPIAHIGVLLWIGLALFMMRHLYRFLRWRHSGEGDWRAARRSDVTGKQA